MSLAIGIDLGTTNSCVAVVRDGKARVVQDASGVALHPSVISFHPDGRVLIGPDAADRRVIDPQNTFYSVKRLIGRDFSDPDVMRVAERYPYTVIEGPKGIPLAQSRGKEYTLPEISSLVLGHLRDVAEAAMQEEAGCSVITVPANFNDVQRSSTRVAGRIAGLDVQRILNEPTAAALAYGYGQGLNERVAVYDFGGGTFDITILDLRDNVFEVMATAGDMFLGGDDLDARLVDQMVASFLQLHHVDLRDSPIALQRLRGVGEQIKCQLSSRTQVSARIRELEYGPGGKPLDMNFAVTRDGFEQRIADLVDRSFMVCDEAFRLAQLTPSQLDNIILVGGTTRTPLVRERVREYFGMDPRTDINPDEVVAIGAAIQAFALSGQAAGATRSQPAPQSIGRPIGAAESASDVDAETDTAIGGRPAGAKRPSNTVPGMPGPTSPAAAAFGGGVPDDLPGRPGDTTAQPAPTGAAAAFGGQVPDDLPGRPGDTTAQPAPTGAAAAFGGQVPDDLPGPKAAGGVTDLPAPAGGPTPTQPGQGASDLPAPVGGPTTTQPGHGVPDLPAPVQQMPPTPSLGKEGGTTKPGIGGAAAAFGGQVPDNLPGRPGAKQPPPPPPAATGAAAAFGGQVPDDLPSPKGAAGGGADLPAPQGGAMGGGADLPAPVSPGAQAPDLPTPMGGGDSGADLPAPTQSGAGGFGAEDWGGGGLAEGLSEESVIGEFTEEVKAPASLGRPPPGASPEVPDMAATMPGSGPAGEFSAEDFGGGAASESLSLGEIDEAPDPGAAMSEEWNVLSTPDVPKPKVTPLPVEYVESAVDVAQQQQIPAAATAGVQAPGVAPLPSQLMNEMGINHILIDVTPRTLAVQTVQGYCDPIIERNSPIPIEQTRVFTTSRDDQEVVIVKIAQGESRRVEENTVLGEVSLSDIRRAARGEVRIAVTFEIDTDGIVQVSARDVDTGQQAVTKVTVFGGMSDDEVRDLVQRYGRQ